MVTFNIHASDAITGTPNNTTFLRGDGTWNTPSGGTIAYQTVSGTTNINTTSESWVDISQMSLTVAVAGTYFVIGSITVYNDRPASLANNTSVRIIKNTTHLIGGHSLQGDNHANATQYDESQITLHTITTLAINEVLKMQWYTNGGTSYNNATEDYRSRTLTILKLA